MPSIRGFRIASIIESRRIRTPPNLTKPRGPAVSSPEVEQREPVPSPSLAIIPDSSAEELSTTPATPDFPRANADSVAIDTRPLPAIAPISGLLQSERHHLVPEDHSLLPPTDGSTIATSPTGMGQSPICNSPPSATAWRQTRRDLSRPMPRWHASSAIHCSLPISTRVGTAA